MFDDKIPDLRKEIITYAGLVEGMIRKSIAGLVEKDEGRLLEVLEKDESRSNETEIFLDEMCIRMIAQYAPKAKDLRTVLMVYTMSADLERMADHAVNISESARFLINRPQVKPLIDIPRMADIATRMVRDSITAFVNEDAILARAVCEGDQVVDGLMEQILRELVTYMSRDSGIIERAVHLLSIGRNLERIADLSTNICEDVIFMVEGRVIKHGRGLTGQQA